jgi:hypothetical protein
MWLRMLTVVVEMEAKKEYALILGEIHKLHHHHQVDDDTHKSTPKSVQKEPSRR